MSLSYTSTEQLVAYPRSTWLLTRGAVGCVPAEQPSALRGASPLWLSAYALLSIAGAAVALGGCNIFSTTCSGSDRTCLNGGLSRSGDACIRDGECAVGLACTKSVCQYTASSKEGAACIATAECAAGLYCTSQLTCAKISDNPQPVGGSCGGAVDCQKGLACDIDVTTLFATGPYGQLSDQCKTMVSSGDALPDSCKLPKKCVQRGTKDSGAACKSSAECVAGYYCQVPPAALQLGDAPLCLGGVPLPLELLSIPEWKGQTCPADATTPTAYFEVPRAGQTPNDFYRLPFPNDVRKKDGKIDLSAHPVPPASLGVPIVERFLKAAGDSSTGFSTNPVMFFRFSEAFEGQSVTSVHIVDITPSSPEYNSLAAIEWSPTGATSHYICDNWLAFRRPLGTPLRGGTTYAAILTTAIKPKNGGGTFARSPDFDAMLADQRPDDVDLAAAYNTYAPLRAWLSDTKTSPAELLNAAVFTTLDPESLLPALHDAVAKNGAPQLKEMVVCDTGVTPPSGCTDATKRGECHAANTTYWEIFGKVSLPIFQQGTAPYEKPEDGGAIGTDGAGNAVVQSHLDVCFALTVPKTPAPTGGFPVVIYAHGTGGSFTSETGSGSLANDVATGPTPGVLLAIDMPEHGNRRGSSTRPPEDLFYNFLNPAATRGNVLQGSADLMSLALLVRSGGISKIDSPTGAAISFDSSRVLVFGHSQGATHASIMLPFEGGATAGVLSGIGGHLATSLLTKEKPVNLGAIIPFVLFDADTTSGKLALGSYNPVLALIQMYSDASDPINYAHRIYRDPASSARTGHDLFMTYGLTDSYAPEQTQMAYALAGALTQVTPVLRTNSDLATILPAAELANAAAPLQNNVTVGTTPRTVGMRQYTPSAGTDGHFVAADTGHADVKLFVQQVLDGKAPQIGM